jgi:hypothetical protein
MSTFFEIHVDGNMPFCNEKLKIIAKGIQMVSEVL